MQGVLNLNKPAGPTSHDVVARVRRALKLRRVGHAGTLDPMARGVLLVCVGSATRIVEYFRDLPKSYRAELLFGVTTDTQDITGAVREERPAGHVRAEELKAVLERFRGPIAQVPPMVSAVKHEGRRLYQLARAGQEVARAPRPVMIHALSLCAFEPGEHPRALLSVTCSGGTYIRTLCADIGEALGVGATLADLERTRVGPFSVEESLTLEEMETLAAAGRIVERLLSPAEALSHLPAVVLDAAACRALSHGQRAVLQPSPLRSVPAADLPLRLLDAAGELVAIGRLRQEEERFIVTPEKVFRSPDPRSEVNGGQAAKPRTRDP